MNSPPLHASPRSARSTPSAKEQEYIHNLQQQIRYLELQGDLIREQLATPGPALKNKATLASPALEPRFNLAAPLDDPVNAIRERYIREVEEGKHRVAEIQSQARRARIECERLEKDLTTAQSQNTLAERDAVQALTFHEAQLLTSCTNNEWTKIQLAEQRAHLATRKAALAAWDARTAELQKRAEEAKRKIASLDEAIRKERRLVLKRSDAETLERRLAECVAIEECLSGDIQRLDSLILHREGELKTEGDLCWTLRSKSDALHNEAERLRSRIEALEREAQRTLEDLRALGADRGLALTKLTEMRTLCETATRRYEETGPQAAATTRALELELSATVAATDKLAHELRDAREREQARRVTQERARAQLDETGEDAGRAAGFWLEQEAGAAQASNELQTLERQLRGLEATGAKARDVETELHSGIDEATVAIELLSREIAERGDTGSVDVHELAALRSTNEALAQTIGELMRRIPAQGEVGLTLRDSQGLATR